MKGNRDSINSSMYSEASSRAASKRGIFTSKKSSVSSIAKNYLGKQVIVDKPQGDDDFDLMNEDD